LGIKLISLPAENNITKAEEGPELALKLQKSI